MPDPPGSCPSRTDGGGCVFFVVDDGNGEPTGEMECTYCHRRVNV